MIAYRRACAVALALAGSDASADPCPTPPHPTMTVMVPMPDGTALATDVYLEDTAPRPVLVIRGANARCGIAGGLASVWPAGAVFDLVVQDIRGTGSPTSGDFIYSQDGADGRALLAWIDHQSWSQGASGHLAMVGWSHAGIVDYLATPGAGTSMRGLQPHFATGDILNYGLFNGGVLHRETAQAIEYAPGTPWRDYVGLPIWDGYLVDDRQAASVRAAGLHIGGWFDVFGQGTLDSFSRLQAAGGTGARGRQKVVIGPWIHGGNGTTPVGQLTFPSSTTIDAQLPAYDSAWKQGVFQDNWTAWDALPAAKVYVMGATPGTEWRTYTTWPPPAVEVPLYFTSTRGLTGDHQRVPGQLAFTADPGDPCPTLGGTNNLTSCVVGSGGTCGPYDQRSIEARSDVVVFTSAPLPAGGTIIGRSHADVWIATDLPDVDVFVRMTDVYPDGRSMLMAQGIQRARYRNGTCPAPLVANEPALVRVDLSSTALVFGAGHAVRVIVSASAGSLYTVNPQNGDEYAGAHPNRSGSIQVLVGAGHESALVVPVPGGQTPPPDERPVTEACPGTNDTPDGGPPDAGVDSSDPSHPAGCGCRAGSGYDAAPPILLVLAAVIRRRRPGTTSAVRCRP